MYFFQSLSSLLLCKELLDRVLPFAVFLNTGLVMSVNQSFSALREDSRAKPERVSERENRLPRGNVTRFHACSFVLFTRLSLSGKSDCAVSPMLRSLDRWPLRSQGIASDHVLSTSVAGCHLETSL